MSEHNQQLPPRPSTWSMADEGYTKVTKLDYYGKPYEVWERPTKDLGQLWKQFKSKLDEDQTIRRQVAIIQASTDLHDEATQLDNDKWNEKIELHETLKLIEP